MLRGSFDAPSCGSATAGVKPPLPGHSGAGTGPGSCCEEGVKLRGYRIPIVLREVTAGSVTATSLLVAFQNRGFSKKSHPFLPKLFRKMSTQSAKERPESLHFPFLDDEDTISTLKESKTFFILRGLPGSGKSTLAHAIQDRYKDACKVISVDSYKITPSVRSAIPEEYSKVDEDLVDYCKRDISVIVLDDTHHERERLDQLFDIADKYRYKVIFAEPKTPWRQDCSQLKEKNQWKLSVEELKKMKPSLEKEFLPMYFGWFLSKRSSEILRKAGQAFLDELASLKAFKKESKYCTYGSIFPSSYSVGKMLTLGKRNPSIGLPRWISC